MTSEPTPRDVAGATAADADRTAGRPAESHPDADTSTSELVSRLSTQLSELVRGELALARAELTEKGKRAGAGAGMTGAAGVTALYGGGALVVAAISGIAQALSVWLAALVVGIALLVVAGVLALMGRSQMRKAAPPVPQEAMEGVKKDVDTVREGMRR